MNVLIVGNAGTGKTEFAKKLILDKFENHKVLTINPNENEKLMNDDVSRIENIESLNQIENKVREDLATVLYVDELSYLMHQLDVTYEELFLWFDELKITVIVLSQTFEYDIKLLKKYKCYIGKLNSNSLMNILNQVSFFKRWYFQVLKMGEERFVFMKCRL